MPEVELVDHLNLQLQLRLFESWHRLRCHFLYGKRTSPGHNISDTEPNYIAQMVLFLLKFRKYTHGSCQLDIAGL